MIARVKANPGRKFDQVRAGARNIFLRDGYAGASVDDIARAAGVSKATLYSYFPEKELMYREVFLDEAMQISGQTPIQIRPEASAAEALPVMTRQIADWLLSDRVIRLYRMNIGEALRFPDVSQRFHEVITGLLRDVVRGHLDRWVISGELDIEDTALAADQLIRLSGALLHDRALLSGGQKPRESTIAQMSNSAAQLFLRAQRRGTEGKPSLSAAC